MQALIFILLGYLAHHTYQHVENSSVCKYKPRDLPRPIHWHGVVVGTGHSAGNETGPRTNVHSRFSLPANPTQKCYSPTVSVYTSLPGQCVTSQDGIFHKV